MSEFRQDPVTGRRVIIASGRADRPWHIGTPKSPEHVTPCPFCAGREAMTPPEVWANRDPSTTADSPGWRVRVVPNKYPALESSGKRSEPYRDFYAAANGCGLHEVIIETPDHVVDMSALSAAQFVAIVEAYRTRLKALRTQRRWRYWLIYKNHGERAGATLEHIHSQLVALPFVPREARQEIHGARKHFKATGRCIYCAMIERERAQGARVVLASERFIALCPFAPRFGYETWILPLHHASSFEHSSHRDLEALADTLRTLILKLNRIAAHTPFNYLIHTEPAGESANELYHWHLELLPQITRAAGFEWGSGVHMNSVSPEDAARSLRDAPL